VSYAVVIPIAVTTGAIAVIWTTLLVRFLGLFGCCMVWLVVTSCFGYDFYNVRVGPLPVSADRLLLGGLFGLYAIQRGLKIVRSKPLDVSDLTFGAFLAVLTASTLLHDWRWRGFQPLASLLFLYLYPAVLYWLVRESFSGERCIRILFSVMALFGLYLGLTAIAEVGQFYAVIFPRYIITSSNTEWLGRARGPFLNPTTNGLFLSASLFAWAMFWRQASRLGKVAVLGGMAIVSIGIYCTLTRSCWIGAVIGLATITAAALPRRIRIPTLIVGTLVVALFLTFGRDSLNSFKRDKNVSQFHMEQSAKLRPILAAVAWRVFKDHPLFGCGYGQYKRVDVDYLRDPTTELHLKKAKGFVQHNLFLGLLVDLGLVGLGTYLACLIGWGWRGWQLWNDSKLSIRERQMGLVLIAVLVQWCINGMFHDVSLPTNANMLIFLMAGVSQGAWLSRHTCLRRATDSVASQWQADRVADRVATSS
jgi:O-antigen ligase